MARGKQPVTGFTALRAIRINGTLYTAGQSVPTAVVGGLKRASALVSRRLLIPSNLQYPKKNSSAAKILGRPAPMVFSSKERRGLGA